MSVYRRRDSQFFAYDFEIDGYRFSGSTRAVNERDAQAVEAERKKEARDIAGRLKAEARAPLTLGAAADRWWREHGQHLADAKNRATLDRLVAILGEKTPLHAINDDAVARLVEIRRRDTRRAGTTDRGKVLRRQITPTTVNRTIDLLRRIVNRARNNWNAATIREPTWRRHRLAEKKRHVRELSAAEESALDAIESFDYAEVRRFAIITGLRRRDVLLAWSQVDFELGVVRVITKGGVPRIIPLTREAYEILWRRRGDHATHVFTYQAKRTWRARAAGDLVKGQRYPITYAGLGSNKARTWSAAGVEARIHDLRHTTGMRMLRKTGNLRAVQKLLGHSDVSTTARFYTDASLEDLRAAMEAAAPREIAGETAPQAQIEDKSK